MKPGTILLIHGMFMNPLCWEKWILRYQAKGYKVLAPAWPGRDHFLIGERGWEEAAGYCLVWLEKVA